MAVPSRKSAKIDSTLFNVFGVDRVEAIQLNRCSWGGCENPCNELDFNNDISRREYAISGLCQSCQDQVFA